MKINKKKILTQGIISFMLMLICSVTHAAIIKNNTFHGITDFGDPMTREFTRHLNGFNEKNQKNNLLVITQFGDSHSAADFFSGELRILLQEKYGDAGIGWVTPMYVSGQYHSLVMWESEGWQVFSSRNTNDRDFPMGGFIAEVTKDQNNLQVKPKNTNVEDEWIVKLAIKPLKSPVTVMVTDVEAHSQQIAFSKKDDVNQWQIYPINVKAPFTINAKQGEIELGGIWLQKYQKSGAILSAIGTNGAKQSIWQKWSPEWYKELASTNSNMVILEYGTNEAFDATLDLAEYRNNLITTIRKIRATLPKSVVLIMSPPDTMLAKPAGGAAEQLIPPNYSQVRQIQQEVAKQEKTLYWDWQTAMGGPGMIKKWQLLDLARSDLVHLTKQGYIESAKIFYRDLIRFSQRLKDDYD